MMSKLYIIALSLCLLSTRLLAQEGLIETYPYVVALYKNCGNEIKIIKPTISPFDKVRYTTSGGEVIVNASDKRIITIVPYSPKVTLKIYRDTTLIGIKEFKVRLIPKPTFEIYADSNAVEKTSNEQEYIRTGITYITIKAKPDSILAADLPYDARYTVNAYRVMLVREQKTIDSLSFTTETGNIKSLLSQAKTGDFLLLEVVSVKRKNFMNRQEEVQLGVNTRVIQIK